MRLPLAPWEAALGARVKADTPAGTLNVTVPANARAGQKLRIPGKGLPASPPGDLYLQLEIVLPKATSDAHKAAWQQLRDAFEFDPRRHAGATA